MLCELYQFITAASSIITPGSTSTTIFRYTNGPIPLSIHEDLTSDPVTYAPQPITRSDIVYSATGIADAELEIPFDIEPFYGSRLKNISTPTWVRIWEYDGTTRSMIFFGQIRTKAFSSSLTTKLKAISIDKLLDRKFPQNTFSTMCRHGFGRPGCGLDPAILETIDITADFDVTTGNMLTHATLKKNSYLIADSAITIDIRRLQGGTLSVAYADGSTSPNLTIIAARPSSNGSYAVIVTVMPISTYPVDGDVITLTHGCDLTMVTCKAFSNQVNFGGFPYLPDLE